MDHDLQERKRKRLQSCENEQEDIAPTVSHDRSNHSDSCTLTTSPQSALQLATGFESVNSYRSYLSGLTSRDAQYDALCNVAHNWVSNQATFDQVAEILDDLATQLNLRDMMKNDEEEIWTRIIVQANVARAHRDIKDSARETIFGILGKDNVERDFDDIKHDAAHTWKYLRSLTKVCEIKNISYADLKRSVLQAQFTRLSEGKRGTSNSTILVAKDFQVARSIIKSGTLKDKAELFDEIVASGYGVLASGFICSLREHSSRLPDANSPFSLECNSSDLVTGGDRNMLPYSEDNRTAYNKVLGSSEVFMQYENNECSTSKETMVMDSNHDGIADDNILTTRKRASYECGCSTTIPFGFIHQLRPAYNSDAIGQSFLIKRWFKHREVGYICYSHTRFIMSALGMKTKGHTHHKLEKTLSQYYTAVAHNKLGDFKTNEETYSCFHRNARPERPDDSLGVYKYAHNKMVGILEFTQADQQVLQEELGIDMEAWHNLGSINMDGMSWWKSQEFAHEGKTIFEIAVEEFDMYDHHSRPSHNHTSYGWLRTMYHGLVQQVMRQDPWYWMVSVALRGDLQHDLVSYPYYAKYQHKGDWTFFRHIDINLPQLVKHKQGLYQIQGTLSLDNEKEDDCTGILPGMHKHIEEWTADLVRRPEVGLSAQIHGISSREYTPEDEARYGIKWIAVPCESLQVRITDPRIPHGAMGPAKGTRRTMLPWYVSLQKGLQHLEIGEAGTFEDLANAHRDLSFGPRTPSGLPNRYGVIPYSFPAAMPITGLGPLSDAIVCRCRHDSAPVIALKKKLLLGGPATRAKYLNEWRRKAAIAVVESWKEVEKLERQCFGEKSYFVCRDKIARGQDVVPVAEDVDVGYNGNEAGSDLIEQDAYVVKINGRRTYRAEDSSNRP